MSQFWRHYNVQFIFKPFNLIELLIRQAKADQLFLYVQYYLNFNNRCYLESSQLNFKQFMILPHRVVGEYRMLYKSMTIFLLYQKIKRDHIIVIPSVFFK